MARVLDRKGIDYVMDYERKMGREPLDVSQKRNFVGFDIISIDRDRKDYRTIEVKSTTGAGIPDAFHLN